MYVEEVCIKNERKKWGVRGQVGEILCGELIGLCQHRA